MKKWPFFIISLLVIVLDQIAKYIVLRSLAPYVSYEFLPSFNFTLVYNTGAAFSFLSGAGDWHKWFFTIFSSIMSMAIIVWMIRLPNLARKQLFSLSLILGGAIGNLIDRVCIDHVVDFIDIYYKNYHWPVFNIADSAITLGAIMLFLGLNSSKTV